jgi:hypothetical protein
MSADNTPAGPYDAMIQGLKDQRAKLDVAIAALEALRDGGVSPMPSAGGAAGFITPPVRESTVDATMFRAMSIPDAAIKLLRLRSREMKNPDIAKELKAGGLIMGSKDAVNTVGAVLTRRSKEVQDIVKTGRGTWALREWTRFAPRPKPKAGDAAEERGALDLGEDEEEWQKP